MCYLASEHQANVWNAFFVTSDGKFNWLSVTALIAIGTFIWSIFYNKKKLKADLISKARLEWMDKIRTLYATFIEDFGRYKYLYDAYFVEKEGSKSGLDALMDEIRRIYYELKLYIPKNQSNKLLLDNIELLWCELSYISDYYNYGRQHGLLITIKSNQKRSSYDKAVDKYLSDLLIKAAEDGSKYFKKEWERAKEGK